MKLAIWSTTAPRENSTYQEMFRRQLEEVELAERIGIDQIWFFEHHLSPTALAVSGPTRTSRIGANIGPSTNEFMLAGCCLTIPVARLISVPRKHARDEQLPTSLCGGCWTGCRNTRLETTPHRALSPSFIPLRDNPVELNRSALDE